MSFVAQPYEQFVSDLLTSLTGGMSGEEHLFIGPGETYTLTNTNIFEDTIRIAGEINEAFATFERGINFTFDSATNSLRWKQGGAQPDDRTYFYVSYYPQEAQHRLTDRNPGSVTTTLAEAFSRELAVLHRQMRGIYESAFVDLAADSALDHVVALLGLTRKNARFASGEVLFKRTSPAPGDVAISSGTVVSTDQGQNFETTDKRTLRRGQLSVTAPIKAQVEGTAGKVDAGLIKNVNRPIFGIDSVLNEAATFFATAKETDEELRRRARGTLERAGKGTVDAIRFALIEDLPEVTEANIQVVEKTETPGYVEVRLGLDVAASPDLVARVEDSIFGARPAGVRVVHNLPTDSQSASSRQAEDITRATALADLKAQGDLPNLNKLPDTVLNSMPDGVLRVRTEVFLKLAGANLTAAQKESIEDAARSTAANYLESLPMGSPIVYSKLLGQIVAPDTVQDASLLIGAENSGQFASFTANLDTSGRKAKADAIFVGLMQENVSIDVSVRVQASVAPQSASSAPAAGPRPSAVKPVITDAQRAAVANALNLLLSAAKNGLSKQSIVDTLRKAIAPALQLISDRPVVVNATYQETGRVLKDTDQVDLAEHEVPILGNLTLDFQGDLDA
jgi:uncharacterized phage protein gp47/JayE